MKKVLMLILLLFSLSGCNKKGKLETTIFVASDIHLFSNNLYSKDNKIYTKDRFVSDGRVQEYDYELVESLVEEVNKEKPEILLLSGDLSFNGEKDAHLELTKLLDKVNDDTQVLVIPGNHDCYSLNPVSVFDDVQGKSEWTTYEDFKEIYKDYGYSNAYSYDKETLSYIYEVSDNKWLLMLDTNQSRFNVDNNMNITGGFIYKDTYNWIEDNLKYAKENNIELISVTHHNLLMHNEKFKTGYTLYNNEDILELLINFDVKINFSGHLHIQSIKNTTVNDKEFYDIASGSLLAYGNRYGALKVYENCYDYVAKSVPFIDESFDFNKYSYDVFYKKYYDKSIYINERTYGNNGKAITELLSEINCYYFDGNYEKINQLKEEKSKLLEIIKSKTSNYEDSYIKTIIDVENKTQYSLLVKK